MEHPQIDECFLQLNSKVDEFMKLLISIDKFCRPPEERMQAKSQQFSDVVNEENFIVTVRKTKSPSLSPPSSNLLPSKGPLQKNEKFTFMRQVESNDGERSKARLERELVAQNFRMIANAEYRQGSYEEAIFKYTKAIENIKDSPVLYINRAICFIKLSHFKRAIRDCDFVLNKLDEKNMRAWLYRGAAYKKMNDECNFENSIKYARKNNSKQLEYIDSFLKKLNTEL